MERDSLFAIVSIKKMTRQQILRYAKRVLLSLSVETHNELSDCKGKYFFCFSKIIADIF